MLSNLEDLWEVVNEEVAAFRSLLLGWGWSLGYSTKHRAVGVGRVTLETSRVSSYGAGGQTTQSHVL